MEFGKWATSSAFIAHNFNTPILHHATTPWGKARRYESVH